jgi:O-antigen/teichoic acid export membrane protein
MTSNAVDRSARGSFYHLVVSGITISLGFIRSVLLMRLLGPDEFGTVNLALFFATFITPLLSFGIDNALIQEKSPSPDAFATHFSLRLIFGSILFLLCMTATPLLAETYGNIVVTAFLALVGIRIFEGFYSTHNIVMRREMHFGALALLNLFASLAMTVTAPLLAYLGAGFWSLVIEQAVGPLVRWSGIYLIIRPWKISLKINRLEAFKQFKFGIHMMATHFLGILLDRFDDFWIGTALGNNALGYYSRAYEIAQYPERVIATPVTNVFFSTYAALQDRPVERTKAFFRSSSFLIRAGFLMTVCLMASTKEFTILLFGESWVPIIPIFRWMLIYILLDPLYANLSYLITGMGRPDQLLRTRIFQMGIFVACVPLFGFFWQSNGVALAADVMMFSGVALLLKFSREYVHFSMRRLLAFPSFALIISTAAAFIPDWSSWFVEPWVSLVIKSMVCSSIFVGTLFLFEQQETYNAFRWLTVMIKELVTQTKTLPKIGKFRD